MPATRGSAPTILVVDDEAAVLDLVQCVLKAAGYAVLAAGNGRQALSYVESREHAIDLLLTDINMPDISGLELACRVSYMAPHLPVMFMTGSSVDNPGVELLRREGPFGDCAVMTKPFTPTQLVHEVTGVFSVH